MLEVSYSEKHNQEFIRTFEVLNTDFWMVT